MVAVTGGRLAGVKDVARLVRRIAVTAVGTVILAVGVILLAAPGPALPPAQASAADALGVSQLNPSNGKMLVQSTAMTTASRGPGSSTPLKWRPLSRTIRPHLPACRLFRGDLFIPGRRPGGWGGVPDGCDEAREHGGCHRGR